MPGMQALQEFYVAHQEKVRESILLQGSPQENFKAERVGEVWAGVVTTSIMLVTTSEKYDY